MEQEEERSRNHVYTVSSQLFTLVRARVLAAPAARAYWSATARSTSCSLSIAAHAERVHEAARVCLHVL